jgi:hypothetical protein
MSNEATRTDWTTLVGKFFHEFGEDGYVERQGVIVAEPYPQVFVVQYFDWLTDRITWGLHLVALDNILRGNWQFYLTSDDMRDAYKLGSMAHRLPPT